MAERYTVTSNSSSNTRLEEAEFEKIQLLAATKAELETKNSGGSPMDTGELAVATDTKSLWHRFSGPDVRKIPFLDGSGNALGTNALDIQSSRSAATQVASGTNSSAIGSRNTASENYSSAIGYDNTASGTNSSAIGYDNIASGYGSSAIGSRNTASGYYSSAFGYRTTTTVNETFEAGYWSNASTRSTAVRLHPNGQVAMTIEDSATAPTDGGATAGSEADGTLGRGMFAIQKNGTALTLYYNNAGTIQSVSLGTLS